MASSPPPPAAPSRSCVTLHRAAVLHYISRDASSSVPLSSPPAGLLSRFLAHSATCASPTAHATHWLHAAHNGGLISLLSASCAPLCTRDLNCTCPCACHCHCPVSTSTTPLIQRLADLNLQQGEGVVSLPTLAHVSLDLNCVLTTQRLLILNLNRNTLEVVCQWLAPVALSCETVVIPSQRLLAVLDSNRVYILHRPVQVHAQFKYTTLTCRGIATGAAWRLEPLVLPSPVAAQFKSRGYRMNLNCPPPHTVQVALLCVLDSSGCASVWRESHALDDFDLYPCAAVNVCDDFNPAPQLGLSSEGEVHADAVQVALAWVRPVVGHDRTHPAYPTPGRVQVDDDFNPPQPQLCIPRVALREEATSTGGSRGGAEARNFPVPHRYDWSPHTVTPPQLKSTTADEPEPHRVAWPQDGHVVWRGEGPTLTGLLETCVRDTPAYASATHTDFILILSRSREGPHACVYRITGARDVPHSHMHMSVLCKLTSPALARALAPVVHCYSHSSVMVGGAAALSFTCERPPAAVCEMPPAPTTDDASVHSFLPRTRCETGDTAAHARARFASALATACVCDTMTAGSAEQLHASVGDLALPRVPVTSGARGICVDHAAARPPAQVCIQTHGAVILWNCAAGPGVSAVEVHETAAATAVPSQDAAPPGAALPLWHPACLIHLFTLGHARAVSAIVRHLGAAIQRCNAVAAAVEAADAAAAARAEAADAARVRAELIKYGMQPDGDVPAASTTPAIDVADNGRFPRATHAHSFLELLDLPIDSLLPLPASAGEEEVDASSIFAAVPTDGHGEVPLRLGTLALRAHAYTYAPLHIILASTHVGDVCAHVHEVAAGGTVDVPTVCDALPSCVLPGVPPLDCMQLLSLLQVHAASTSGMWAALSDPYAHMYVRAFKSWQCTRARDGTRASMPPLTLAVYALMCESPVPLIDALLPTSAAWADVRVTLAPMWLPLEALGRLLDRVAMAEYAAAENDPWAAIVYLLAQGPHKLTLVRALFKNARDHARFHAFLGQDFSTEAVRAQCMKNAYVLVRSHRYAHGAALFMLAGAVTHALDILLRDVCDPMLALAVARMCAGGSTRSPLASVTDSSTLMRSVAQRLLQLQAMKRAGGAPTGDHARCTLASVRMDEDAVMHTLQAALPPALADVSATNVTERFAGRFVAAWHAHGVLDALYECVTAADDGCDVAAHILRALLRSGGMKRPQLFKVLAARTRMATMEHAQDTLAQLMDVDGAAAALLESVATSTLVDHAAANLSAPAAMLMCAACNMPTRAYGVAHRALLAAFGARMADVARSCVTAACRRFDGHVASVVDVAAEFMRRDAACNGVFARAVMPQAALRRLIQDALRELQAIAHVCDSVGVTVREASSAHAWVDACLQNGCLCAAAALAWSGVDGITRDVQHAVMTAAHVYTHNGTMVLTRHLLEWAHAADAPVLDSAGSARVCREAAMSARLLVLMYAGNASTAASPTFASDVWLHRALAYTATQQWRYLALLLDVYTVEDAPGGHLPALLLHVDADVATPRRVRVPLQARDMWHHVMTRRFMSSCVLLHILTCSHGSEDTRAHLREACTTMCAMITSGQAFLRAPLPPMLVQASVSSYTSLRMPLCEGLLDGVSGPPAGAPAWWMDSVALARAVYGCDPSSEAAGSFARVAARIALPGALWMCGTEKRAIVRARAHARAGYAPDVRASTRVCVRPRGAAVNCMCLLAAPPSGLIPTAVSSLPFRRTAGAIALICVQGTSGAMHVSLRRARAAPAPVAALSGSLSEPHGAAVRRASGTGSALAALSRLRTVASSGALNVMMRPASPAAAGAAGTSTAPAGSDGSAKRVASASTLTDTALSAAPPRAPVPTHPPATASSLYGVKAWTHNMVHWRRGAGPAPPPGAPTSVTHATNGVRAAVSDMFARMTGASQHKSSPLRPPSLASAASEPPVEPVAVASVSSAGGDGVEQPPLTPLAIPHIADSTTGDFAPLEATAGSIAGGSSSGAGGETPTGSASVAGSDDGGDATPGSATATIAREGLSSASSPTVDDIDVVDVCDVALRDTPDHIAHHPSAPLYVRAAGPRADPSVSCSNPAAHICVCSATYEPMSAAGSNNVQASARPATPGTSITGAAASRIALVHRINTMLLYAPFPSARVAALPTAAGRDDSDASPRSSASSSAAGGGTPVLKSSSAVRGAASPSGGQSAMTPLLQALDAHTTRVRWGPDGRHVCVCFASGIVRLWDVSAPEVPSHTLSTSAAHDLTLPQLLQADSNDMVMYARRAVWAATDVACITFSCDVLAASAAPLMHSHTGSGMRSSTAEAVASVSMGWALHLFDLRVGDAPVITALPSPTYAGGTCIYYDDVALTLCVGGEDGSITLYDMRTQRVRARLPGVPVIAAGHGRAAMATATATQDAAALGSVLSAAADAGVDRDVYAHAGAVSHLVAHPWKHTLASAGQDGDVKLWSLPDMRACTTLIHAHTPRPILANTSAASLVSRWMEPHGVSALVITEDGVVTAGYDGSVCTFAQQW